MMMFDFLTKFPQSKRMHFLRENRNTKSLEILQDPLFVSEIDLYYFWMSVLMFFLFFCSCLCLRSQQSGVVDGLSTSNPNQKRFSWLRACE